MSNDLVKDSTSERLAVHASATSGKKQLLSSCREGTPLTGLSIEKDRPDPLAKADEAYPAWLWSIVGDSDLVSGSPSSSGGAAGASTMTKGEARAAQKRSVKAARAQQRRGGVDGSADSVAAGNSAKAVGQRDAAEQRFASAEASIRAAEAAEAARAEARRSLRRANREAIKARNFVGSS